MTPEHSSLPVGKCLLAGAGWSRLRRRGRSVAWFTTFFVGVLLVSGCVFSGVSGTSEAELLMGSREEWGDGSDYGECLWDGFVEEVPIEDLRTHFEFLDDPPTATPESVLKVRRSCVRSAGLDYNAEERANFVESCTSSGVGAPVCECAHDRAEATIDYADLYEIRQRLETGQAERSPELEELFAACIDPADSLPVHIPDEDWVAAANEACAAMWERLVAIDAPRGIDGVQALNAQTRVMLDELHGLERTPEAEGVVQSWLMLWEDLLDVGERMAAAMEAGDDDSAREIGNEGDGPATAANTISQNSGMEDCVF